MPTWSPDVTKADGVERNSVVLPNMDVHQTQLAAEIALLGEAFQTDHTILSLRFLSSATPTDLVSFVDAVFPTNSLSLMNDPCQDFLRQTRCLRKFKTKAQKLTTLSSNVSPCSEHHSVNHLLAICFAQVFSNLRYLTFVVAQRILHLETNFFNIMISAPSRCKVLLSSMISQVSLSSPCS